MIKEDKQQSVEEGEEVSESHESSEFITTKKAGRTNICCICRCSLAKYKCPKCSRHTCSLNCNKKHKQLRSCEGLPNPTQYLSMENYADKNGEKDFTYLKQIISSTDKVKKCLTGVTNKNLQPKRFTILRVNARKLHNIQIQHAPTIIERHRQNISFYYVKTKQIYWVVEMIFFKKDNEWSRFITMPTSENKTFAELITENNFLCKDLILDGINTLKVDQFQVYIQKKTGYNRFSQPPKDIQLLKFQTSNRITDCLKNLTIYQFPSIMFVHKSLVKTFLKLKPQRIINQNEQPINNQDNE